ncbi:MAG: hypothetical protein ACODAQ_12460 [Phycisphaeraceae bacterium]
MSRPKGVPGSKGRARAERFREVLAELAQEMGAGFFNLRAAWENYLNQIDTDAQSLRRDAVHANNLGRQVLARIMSRALYPGE